MSRSWQRVADEGALKRGKSMTVEAFGYAVALYNVDGRILATQDACPHEGASLGCGGRLVDGVIACGYHHWEFDVRTGASLDGFDDELWTFPVKVEGGAIWVGLPEGLEPAGPF